MTRDRRPPRFLVALADRAVRQPRRVLALAALLLVFLGPAALRLETDNSPEIFFSEGHQGLQSLESLRATFDPGRSMRVVLSGDQLWSRRGLSWWREVEGALAETPGVSRAAGLVARHGAEAWPPEDPEAFRERTVESPLARGLGWISPDGEVVSVLVHVTERNRLSEVVPALEATLDTLAEPGLRLDLVGIPVLEHALGRSSGEIMGLFFPLLVGVTTLLLLLFLRSWREVLAALLYVTFSLATLLGAFHLLGGTLNLVLTVLPPVLFVIALAVAIHLLIRFRDLRDEGSDPPQAIRDTIDDKGRAVFWTGLTTLVGFASLASAPVAPVRTLGIAAAAGIGLSTVAAFALLPALLRALAGSRPRAFGRERPFERATRGFARRAARSAVGRPRVTILGAVVLAGLAAAALPSLRVASNALEYLPREDPLREAVSRLESLGLPSAAVEVVLERPRGGPSLDSPEGLARLAGLTDSLREIPGTTTAMSAGVLLQEARRETGGLAPPGGDALLVEGLRQDSRARFLLARFLSPDGEKARVSLGVPLGGYPELDRLTDDVRRRVEEGWPGVSVTTTGEYSLLLETQRALLRTLGWSLGISLLVIGGIFLFLLRSLRLTAVALSPNVWPVLLVLGVMGWASIPLDVATVMVAAVVIGLAVDDTIHTLLSCEPRSSRARRSEEIVSAVTRNGPAYSLTSLLLAAGFGVCALSDFAPTARFGMLAALAMVLVWVGALWGLPALLALGRGSSDP